MAACIGVATLKRIEHSGDDIGDDWRYYIRVNNRGGWARGDGSSFRFVPRPQWVIVAGDCGGPVTMNFFVYAEEEDWLVDDEDSRRGTVTLTCPERGATPTQELTISVPVTEDLGIGSGGTNTVKFVFDVSAVCVPGMNPG